jgi:DnaJ-class molecular chaperone
MNDDEPRKCPFCEGGDYSAESPTPCTFCGGTKRYPERTVFHKIETLKFCTQCGLLIDKEPFIGPKNKKPYCNRECAIAHQIAWNEEYGPQLELYPGPGEY